MSVIRRTSRRFQQGHVKRKKKIRGRGEPIAATAANLATKKLVAMGLSREEHGQLWTHFRDYFLERKEAAYG